MEAEAIIAARLFLCLTLVTGLMLGAESWTVASSDHFVLYTVKKREPAIRLLQRMENTSRDLQQLLGSEGNLPSSYFAAPAGAAASVQNSTVRIPRTPLAYKSLRRCTIPYGQSRLPRNADVVWMMGRLRFRLSFNDPYGRGPAPSASGMREDSQDGTTSRDDSPRVVMIAFRSDSDYADYRPDTGASAYYLEGPECSYIVLGAESARDHAVAAHEYAHHLLRNRYGAMPLWLDEGLAEVYSSVAEKHGELRLGSPPGDRLTSLENYGLLLDLESLFETRQTTLAKQRHTEARSRFYAESWLLAHMLRFSRGYSAGFVPFLRGIEAGVSPDQVFQSVYRKDTAQVQADLELYLKEGKFPTETVTLNPPGSRPEVLARQADPVEAPAALAKLLVDLGRFEKAEVLLQNLDHLNPNDSRVRAGVLYLRQRRSSAGAPPIDR